MFRTQPIPPQPGQESVWDYPRPPRLEASTKKILILCQGVTIAETTKSMRVLETSHPPVYYLPPEDVQTQYLEVNPYDGSYCEWKGMANYYTIKIGKNPPIPKAVWSYGNPTPAFEPIKGFLAFYPSLMEACYLDGEKVQPQPGGFYGGWITTDIVGPFKGVPGSWGW